MPTRRSALKEWTDKGVNYVQQKITPANMAQELSKYAGTGGLIIDLAWNIGCIDILTWCHDNKVLYVNTSVEEWDPYADIHEKTPLQKSLYYRQMKIKDMVSKWNGDATTAILDHGANPGLISHFTKRGIVDIANRAIKDKTTPKKTVKLLEQYSEGRRLPAPRHGTRRQGRSIAANATPR